VPGTQQGFGNGAQLLDVVAVLNRSLLHRNRELPAQGGLAHQMATSLHHVTNAGWLAARASAGVGQGHVQHQKTHQRRGAEQGERFGQGSGRRTQT